MSKNYKKGEPITTIDGLMKERVAFFNGRLINREFFQNFQFRFLLNQVEYGRVHKAIPINPQSVSESPKVGYYCRATKGTLSIRIVKDGALQQMLFLPHLREDNNYSISMSDMLSLLSNCGAVRLD